LLITDFDSEEKKTMASRIIGWILIVLGVLAFLAALWSFARGIPGVPIYTGHAPISSSDLQAVADILDAIARILENFARLSLSVQWALLGLASIGVGSYLISKRPF
jgi:uncharacterized membrane protein YiaA